MPTAHERHVLNRLGTGYCRTAWRQLRRAGGAAAWLEAQLDPEGVPEDALAAELPSWFPDLGQDPAAKWAAQAAGVKGGWEYARDLESLTILRRAYSARSVLETMVDFWSNLLHVPSNSDRPWVHRADYDGLIRAHALGRYDELLPAASLHPAMVLYLDTWRSVRDRPNENHGRELLELHTVGRAAGYTEAMVKDAAKILSGHTVAWDTWQPFYDPKRHTTGAVQVLGFTHPNDDADGRAVAQELLVYLARHPATARRVVRKLAVKLVCDEPSAALVDHLARVYLDSGTDISAVLRALVAHPEFAASAGAKVRTPVEDLVATMRVLETRALRPEGKDDYARVLSYAHGGAYLYWWPRPDGSPEHDAAQVSATRMLRSFTMHWNHAGGWWPKTGVVFTPTRAWVPRQTIRFDQLVDHQCRRLHGRPADRSILDAACAATGLSPATAVNRRHAVAGWLGVRLVATLLDHPRHMTR